MGLKDFTLPQQKRGVDTVQDFIKILRGRRRQSTPGGNKKSILKEEDIFGKKVRDIVGIIVGDHLTRHCLVLKYLVPTSFFK